MRVEEAPAALVGDHGAHLAGKLALVAGEEALVLPVEAGRIEEARAVEIGADAHLDARHMLHQNEARRPLVPAQLCRHDGAHVAPVGEHPDIVVGGGEARAVELEHVAAGILREVAVGRGGVGELERARHRKAELGEDALREGAVVLEPVPEGGAADHLETVAAKRVLERAALRGDVLDEDHAVLAGGADPGELAAPIGRSRHKTLERALGERLGRRHPDLVALLDEAPIERAEVAIVADAEEAHGPLYSAGSQKTRG